MSANQMVFRARCFLPDGTTVLTPRAGSAHSEPFQITTVPGGLTGWRPYMATPIGRRGNLDRLKANSEIGELRLEVLDMRTGTSNALRWVTAFIGDTHGRMQFNGCTMAVDSSVNDGRNLTLDASWTPMLSWAVTNVEAPDPELNGPVLVFTLMDQRVEETRTAFKGIPHHSVSYAKPCRLWPIGSDDFGGGKGWAGVGDATTGAPAVMADNYGSIRISHDMKDPAVRALRGQTRYRVSEALAASLDRRSTYVWQWGTPMNFSYVPVCLDAMAWVKVVSTGASGWFQLSMAGSFSYGENGLTSYDGETQGPAIIDQNGDVKYIALRALPVGHPRYMAVPAAGTAVEVKIYHAGLPRDDAPLLIHGVNPAQLYRDMLRGYFGDLAWTAEDATAFNVSMGDPTLPEIAQDSTSFGALTSDPSLPSMYFAVAQPEDIEKFAREKLFALAHFNSRVTNRSAVELVDLRVPVNTASLPALGSSDFIEFDWSSGRDTVTEFVLEYNAVWQDDAGLKLLKMLEPGKFADIHPTGLYIKPRTRAFLSPLYGSMRFDPETFDASGLPVILAPDGAGAEDSGAHVVAVRPYMEQFGTGASYATARVKRSATSDGLWQGAWVRVTSVKPPNPSNNQRGGARLMMILSRDDMARPGEAELKLLDGGPDVHAVAPSIALAASSSDPMQQVTGTFTCADAIEVQWAQVAPGGTLPAEGSSLWRFWTTLAPQPSGITLDIGLLSSGLDTYVRARGVGTMGMLGQPQAPKFPSGWVTAGPVTTTGLPAPSGLAATVSGETVVVTFTPGSALYGTVRLIDGVEIDARGNPLPPGSTRAVFNHIVGGHNLGLRHVAPGGGISSVALIAVTGAATAQLDPPYQIQILQGRATGDVAAQPPPGQRVGYGLRVRFRPADLGTSHVAEVSTALSFATIEQSIPLIPGVTEFNVLTEHSDVKRYVRIIASMPGFADSVPSEVVSALPTELLLSDSPDRFPGGWAALWEGAGHAMGLDAASADPDTDRLYYAFAVNAVDFPVVDDTSSYVDKASFPYHAQLLDSSSNPVVLHELDTILLTTRFWNARVGFGQESYDRYTVPLNSGLPTISNLTVAENNTAAGKRLQVAVTLTPPVALWRVWAKRGGWPTMDGTSGGVLDDRMLRAENSAAKTATEWSVSTLETWYVIAVGYTSSGAPGPRKTASTTTGSTSTPGTGPGALLNVAANAPGATAVVTWAHNAVVAAGASGQFVVDIDRDTVRVATGVAATADSWTDTAAATCTPSTPGVIIDPSGCTYQSVNYDLMLRDTVNSLSWSYSALLTGYFQGVL